ncbi:MAG TPA: TIGR00282 family metallophosphoesterase [Phycisphaerales bacterium]|nr:TIGR00282 family metallophosphoesterase [Phycisphaerales bacterium]
MPELTVAFLGDVVGSPGREAATHAARVLRAEQGVSLVIANAENARHGSGLSADNYRALRRGSEVGRPGAPPAHAGIDAVTLGDHAFRERSIIPLLGDPTEPLLRPANLSATAPGKPLIRLPIPAGPPLYVLTVLGRLFMPLPADSPFAAVDRLLAALPEPEALVIVEIHAEATSEKQAMAWHCLGRWGGPAGPRVVAVLGSHTHVQTADARLLEHRLAAMTDLGMTGPHRGVIGRSAPATLDAMVNQNPTPLDVASDDVRAQGCVLTLDPAGRRALGIRAVDMPVR